MHLVQVHVQVGVILVVMDVVTIVIQDVQAHVTIPAKKDVPIHVVIVREAVSITVLLVTVAVKDVLEVVGVAAMVVQKEILVEIQGIVEILAVEVVVETVMAVQGVTDVLVVMVVRVLVMAPACLDVYTLAKGIVKTDVQVHVLVDVLEVASSQRKAHLAVEQVQNPESSHPALIKTEYIQ